MEDPQEDLDASLQDFETPLTNPNSLMFSPSLAHRPHLLQHQPHQSSNTTATHASVTTAPVTTARLSPGVSNSIEGRSPEDEIETSSEEGEAGNQNHRELPQDDPDQESEGASGGGFSPPAWRRLGNGDRSGGFWRGPLSEASREGSPELQRRLALLRDQGHYSSDFDDTTDDEIMKDDELITAIKTKLPRGSKSPEKGTSPGPDGDEDVTIKVNQGVPALAAPNTSSTPNYIRFAVRAEVLQRTEPLENLLNLIRHYYAFLTSTWLSTFMTVVISFFAVSLFQSLMQPAAPRPAGDLVKVAGIARSFEPLIYYSENAVAQVQDLQATSVAVWDLGESIRSSDMKDAGSIVADLDALSETMKTLAIEMTKFFARVDGDIDGILNVMDWARMHLNRLNTSRSPSTISSAYDNLHNLLSSAHVLEDSSGSPTSLGTLTNYVFGLSHPQREQRLIQLLFTEFLAVLEDSIASELQHSVTLFALFEAIDFHFLNLARTVIREDAVQEELHADLLSSLWTRILGGKAPQLRKFEQNRLLLRNIRDKTVYNKAVLVEHNGKLLTLKASLESLRSKLVSPLVRGVNSSTLTLDDQIRGLSDVSNYLADVRRSQRGKVMESLFASAPGRKYMIDGTLKSMGGDTAQLPLQR